MKKIFVVLAFVSLCLNPVKTLGQNISASEDTLALDNKYEEIIKTYPEDTSGRLFEMVETMPVFSGNSSMMDYLERNLKTKKTKHAKIIVSFVVETDGSLSNVNVMKSSNPSLNQEVVRVLSEMPKWIPGMQKGIRVRVRNFMPINF